MTTTTQANDGFPERILMCLQHEIETLNEVAKNVTALFGAMQKHRSEAVFDHMFTQEYACALSLTKMGFRLERTPGEMDERRYQVIAVGTKIDPDGYKMTLSDVVEFVEKRAA
jgi:hypothetical protein